MKILLNLLLVTSLFSSTEFCTNVQTTNSHIKFSFDNIEYVLPTSKLEAYKEPLKNSTDYSYFLFFEEEGCVISQIDYENLIKNLGL